MFRFIVGFTNIGTYLAAFTIATELVGPSKRTFVGMVINFYTSAGLIIYGLLAYLIRDWRYLQLAITLPNMFFFFIIPIVPESVRWLMSQKKFDEAEDLIKECARVNKAETLPEKLFEEEMMVDPSKGTTYTVADLFKTPNLRKKTINILYNWMVNSLVYYGLSLSTASLGGRDYLAFILSGVVEIPAFIVAIPAIDKFGRRPVLCLFMVMGGIACFATVWIPLGWGRTFVALIGKFGIAGSFGIIYVFSAELYPTPVRSVGMGISSMTARVGGIIAPIILELGKIWPPLPQTIFSIMSISAGFLALLLPETLNKNLPETIEDGENFGKKKTIHKMKDKSDVEKENFSCQTEMESSFTNKALQL
ncbi:organic cation transporter protein-like [Anneissia japonica]|uniref:organic cation transporter protein-like n=1 Tax=Anneissia japonica TaxID=1529436 RepID=UPI001425AAFC|nr:organic cation transporter protein-like [Anneissia japonica]